MPLTVWPALGTTLGCDFTTPGTYVVIGQVLSISGPEAAVGSAETTNLSSTAKPYRPTLPDPGTISFSIEFDPTDATTHQKLETLQGTPAIHGWQITFSTGGSTHTCTIQGFLTKFAPSAGGPEENLTADIEVQLTGPLTWV